ncbi:aminopeptidase N [Phycicoccus sp. CSK15P-2]|uniref:aminopeptidase N n=1 Tax=Phycicoccus sp. CSK15P-2 TaxID=2807627 RepID=UPI001950685C|nr:aminopeptidase N [Phycicoccus sp. CSK15P-2]MBM6404249.1 aminopeptidase N [Phycicoccus sp. CSK15P-2]
MPGTNLTREEAVTRASLVAVSTHDVEVDLTTGPERFSTTSTVRFTCAEPGAETFVDFVGASVEEVLLNGVALDPTRHYADSRVRLPGLAAENELVVRATGLYTNTGEGLHRFVDPVDDEVYLYSQFEVPDSRRMYPVFEQPDLKAEFAFTVTAPAHWQVVSNSPTPQAEPVRDGVATWRFERTPRMSSYVTALVAGPYDVVRDSVTGRGGEVPLGIFCRRSLTPYLDADELLDVTKRGFAFFEDEFDCAYPFAKYDQLFAPEYNMGAMENAGCVTVSEIYLFRSKVTEAIRERRALTVLHELAHMWFGDLVTMRWWNDLWLNESFAEWASTTCQAEATRWTDAWTTFGTYEKDWAYDQDQLSTTHPIVAEIRDLRDVEVNFDGITYAKGASVLKQLVAYVGREDFRDGLRTYFRTHAWGNTTLDDLLSELEATSGRDLRSWSDLWLETAGVNTLRPLVEVDDAGRYVSVAIEQTAPADLPTLRPHRLGVGLYEVRDGALVRTDLLDVDVAGERTDLPSLVGRQQPDLLLVNDDDLAYAKIRLDERSLATALAHPRGFVESLPRALVLASAWDMTRDGEMGARAFVDLVLASLPGETDSTLLRTLVIQLRTAVYSYTAPAHREATRATTRDALWSMATQAEPGSDAQLQLVTAAAALTSAGDDPSAARGLLDGDDRVPGLEVDFEMRWTLLTALAAAGDVDGAEIEAELAREDTATARERAARTRAAIPTAEAKETAWREVVDETGRPNAIVEATGLGFARAGTPSELLRPFVDRYHAMLGAVESHGSHAVVESLVLGFYPAPLVDAALFDATQRWLDENPSLPAALRRLVTENRDAVARALTAQERDARD